MTVIVVVLVLVIKAVVIAFVPLLTNIIIMLTCKHTPGKIKQFLLNDW